MKEYKVRISESLVRTVTVEAESAEEARYLVERAWKDGEHVLDANDFQEVRFTIPHERVLER